MPAEDRIRGLGSVMAFVVLGAVTIPTFARGAATLPTEPTTRSAAVPRRNDVAVARPATRHAESALDAVPAAERGDTSLGISGQLRIHLLAPGSAEPGVYSIPGGVGGYPFAFIGVVPFVEKRGATIGTYHVGFWPAELHAVRSAAYDNPTGFVEVTAENANTPVSAHFRLGDLVTHDGAPLPKYIVLREALLDKLELVLTDLEMHGVSTRHVQVLSGFRTPAYNFALGDASGRARESRHQYGDAADIIIDSDHPGHMDDLNHDGRVDAEDVRVIEAAVNRVERAHPELAGGLGLYETMGPSGPFAHIDVRGTRARWGTIGRPSYTSLASFASYGQPSRTRATGYCDAEGPSAVLCQGFRHTRR